MKVTPKYQICRQGRGKNKGGKKYHFFKSWICLTKEAYG